MALMQQRDMLRKELALARVCRADSVPLNKSLVFSSSSIWRGMLLRSWVIWGRYAAALDRISTSCGQPGHVKEKGERS